MREVLSNLLRLEGVMSPRLNLDHKVLGARGFVEAVYPSLVVEATSAQSCCLIGRV